MGRKRKATDIEGKAEAAGAEAAAAGCAGSTQNASIFAGAAAAAAAKAVGLSVDAVNIMTNPAMAAVIAGNPFLAGHLALFSSAAARPVDDGVHPDVRDLCQHFHLDERVTKRLHETLKARPETFEVDLLSLWDVLDTARNPPGLLSVKIKEMEEGSFVARIKPDADIQDLTNRYRLDNQAACKLTEVLRTRSAMRKDILATIADHLESSNTPSATVMMLVGKIRSGEPLGEAPPRVGGAPREPPVAAAVAPADGRRRAGEPRSRERRSRERRSRERPAAARRSPSWSRRPARSPSWSRRRPRSRSASRGRGRRRRSRS